MAESLRFPRRRSDIDDPNDSVLKGILIGGMISILFWVPILWFTLS